MIMTMTLRGNTNKKCAFCRHWYDPANQYIQPKTPSMGIWQYESTAKCTCLLKNVTYPASHQCSKFENKIG